MGINVALPLRPASAHPDNNLQGQDHGKKDDDLARALAISLQESSKPSAKAPQKYSNAITDSKPEPLSIEALRAKRLAALDPTGIEARAKKKKRQGPLMVVDLT